MPNGGDPEKCALAQPFFDGIKTVLESFSQKSKLEYTKWHHDVPLFIFGSNHTHEGNKKNRTERLIKLEIEPLFGMNKAIFSIFVTAVSGDRMRFKSWWIAKGVLMCDKERLDAWLEVAHSILGVINDEDITINMRLGRQEILRPIFDTTGPLGEKLYWSM